DARSLGIGQFFEDRRGTYERQLRRRLSVAGVRGQRSRVSAARRPDFARQLVSDQVEQAREVHTQPHDQLQSVVVRQLRRRPVEPWRELQHALAIPELLEQRWWYQLQYRWLRRSIDARRPRRPDARQRQRLAVPEYRRSQGRELRLELQLLQRRTRIRFLDRAGRHVPSDVVVFDGAQHQLGPQHQRRAVGDE